MVQIPLKYQKIKENIISHDPWMNKDHGILMWRDQNGFDINLKTF